MDNNVKFNKYMNHAAPLNYNMGNGVLGSYDNLRLKTPCKDNWRHPPCNPTGKVEPLFVPQNTFHMYQMPEIMFLFTNNYSSYFFK